MINYKVGQLNKEEKIEIDSLLTEVSDIYGDFYVTQKNIRLFLKDNSHLLYDGLKNGDKVTYQVAEGLLFVHGYSDNANRKFIKVLVKSNAILKSLLDVLRWNVSEDLYIKIKKNNPIYQELLNNNFKFVGDRGREILLMQKGYNNAK